MAFRLPAYNIDVLVYSSRNGFARVPPGPSDPIRLEGVPAVLAVGRRVNTITYYYGQFTTAGMGAHSWLLYDLGQGRIRGPESAGTEDYVEVPQGSGRYYVVYYSDVAGYGFENEHGVCCIHPLTGTWQNTVPK